jgi:hypothetical protein
MQRKSKANSDKFTALSSQFDNDAQVNKLANQYANYSIRNGFIISKHHKMLMSTEPYNLA